jgi:hypothetical protein
LEVRVSAPTTVDIPAEWLAQEPQLPDRCAAHGLPAVRRVTFAVRSNPKIGSRAKVFQPGYTSLNRAEEYAKQVKIVKMSGWPLCAKCVRRRTVRLILTGLLFFGGLLAMIAGFVVAAVDEGPNKAPIVPILLGLAAILVSPLPFRSASLPKLAHAEVTPEGSAVRVVDADTAFAEQLPRR